MSSVVLRAEGIEKTYNMDARTLRVLRGVSLEVRKGEVLAIEGPSGAGKSTLLHILGLLDEPDRGRVFIDDVDVFDLPPRERARYRNERIGFVFQFYHLFKDLTALENVCLPRMVRDRYFAYRAERASIEARARELLGRVGLGDRLGHRPGELSGGERQRVAIARALMNEPEIVFCDEPTGNLDQRTAAGVLDLLWKLNAETGQTFVIVTHDEALARRAHRAVRVVDGRIADGAAAAPELEDTRFRLHGRPPRGGWGRSPVVVGLAGALPFGAPVWAVSATERFWRATRRGRRGATVLLALLFVPAIVALPVLAAALRSPVRAANEILRANGRPEIGSGLVPAILWPIAFFAILAAIFFRHRLPEPWFFGALAGGHALLGAFSAALQSLHNRFYATIEASPSCPRSA
jgi:lipoprotein-releasing system ATP-binding protein